MPSAENSYIGKRPRVQKQLIHKHLASETPARAETVLAAFPAAGMHVGGTGQAVLGEDMRVDVQSL
jgi:hypothetical protein